MTKSKRRSKRKPSKNSRYRLVKQLSRGSRTEIWEGRIGSSIIRRSVCAIKLMHHAHAQDDAAVEAFFREARIGHEVTSQPHANVITTLDSGHWPDGRPYIAMELVQGTTLGEIAKSIQKSPSEDPRQRYPMLIHITRELLNALSHIHDSGFIHHGVTFSNILITPQGTVKLGDFGQAKTADTEEVTTRDDLNDLGALLFEMMVGQPPPAESRPVVFDNVLNEFKSFREA